MMVLFYDGPIYEGPILWWSYFMRVSFMMVLFYDGPIYEGLILWWSYFMKVSFYDGLIL